VPTWRYRFFGGGPPLPGAKSASNPAAHAAEISYVFNSFGWNPFSSASSVTAQKRAVSNEFQSAWGEFAKDPQNGPKKLGWPLYDPKGAI
jgi:carboxylesterase type B